MKDIQLKICGIVPGKTDEKIDGMADLLGFIFVASSPRQVTPENFEKIKSFAGIQKVGVFVDESREKILELVEKTGLSLVQLHGNESPELCRSLRKFAAVIKAIPIGKKADLQAVARYRNCVDYFLFDTRGDYRGGNGIKFNWDLLKEERFGHPFFLSGGISRQDADIIRNYDHPELAGIDINSCFEIQPGQKDLALINEFKMDLYV